MKTMIFTLVAFAASFAAASTSTQLSCNVVRLTDAKVYTVVDATLNCTQQDVKLISTLEYGIVSFACERVGSEIAVSVRLPNKDVTLSSGRTLSVAAEPSSFSSYYATVDDALMISCRN